MAEDLTRWEYKYWTNNDLPPFPSNAQKERSLNEMGKQGWEIVGTTDGIIFKRPLRPNQPQRNVQPYNPPYNGR